MAELHYDLCVIGGGINGAGIARDAAGRGLSVLLVEADDLAGATSSASSKLIHGGLRYLKYMQFKLVKESLAERDVLLKIAPHLVRSMPFVLPIDGKQTSFFHAGLGLFLYDFMSRASSLPKSRSVNLHKISYGYPLREHLHRGYVYTDCWGDDTRLVILNALDAFERGATIRTHTICNYLHLDNEKWIVGLYDQILGKAYEISSSMIVNATGPWVRRFLEGTKLSEADDSLPSVRLVKGSHIILPRQFEGEQVYVLQQPDGRIVFVMPYMENFTLVGTTEQEFQGNPKEVLASEEEVTYLCGAYNKFFKTPILPEDVVFTYSGVRPLFDDNNKNMTQVSRDYRLYHHKKYPAPLLSVFGGKLTTYRSLSERAVNVLLALSGRKGEPWTSTRALPGGNLPEGGFAFFYKDQQNKYPWLPEDLLYRYAESYGRRMCNFLNESSSLQDLGENCGDGVYEAEIRYLVDNEWARTVEDILWRRSKIGLYATDKSIENITRVLQSLVI